VSSPPLCETSYYRLLLPPYFVAFSDTTFFTVLLGTFFAATFFAATFLVIAFLATTFLTGSLASAWYSAGNDLGCESQHLIKGFLHVLGQFRQIRHGFTAGNEAEI